jgi:hypothetical protein
VNERSTGSVPFPNRRASLAAAAIVLVLVLAVAVKFLPPFLPIDLAHYLAAGRILLARQSPYGLVEFFFPPWSVALLGPLSFLPVQLATTIWLLAAAGSQSFASISPARWLGRPLAFGATAGLVALGVLMPPALFAYVTGQVSPLVGAAALFAMALARAPRPPPAAIALALAVASLKPHIVVLPILVCLAELVARRRWVHLAWIGLVALGLFAAGVLVLPDWIPSLTAALRGGAFLGGPSLVAPGYRGLLQLGVPYWLLLPLAIYFVVLWVRERLTPRLAALALALGLLLTPYTRAYDQVLLAFPASLLLLVQGNHGSLRTFLTLLAVLVLPWTPAWPLATVLLVAALIWRPRAVMPAGSASVVPQEAA